MPQPVEGDDKPLWNMNFSYISYFVSCQKGLKSTCWAHWMYLNLMSSGWLGGLARNEVLGRKSCTSNLAGAQGEGGPDLRIGCVKSTRQAYPQCSKQSVMTWGRWIFRSHDPSLDRSGFTEHAYGPLGLIRVWTKCRPESPAVRFPWHWLYPPWDRLTWTVRRRESTVRADNDMATPRTGVARVASPGRQHPAWLTGEQTACWWVQAGLYFQAELKLNIKTLIII